MRTLPEILKLLVVALRKRVALYDRVNVSEIANVQGDGSELSTPTRSPGIEMTSIVTTETLAGGRCPCFLAIHYTRTQPRPHCVARSH